MAIPASVQQSKVVPVVQMRGDSDADTALLKSDLDKAERYIVNQKWCGGVKERYFGAGVGGIIAVFLFRIVPRGDADEWLWVIGGDVPCAYLVTDDVSSPREAVEVYCEMMSDWVDAVRSRSGDLDDVFPVDAPATDANAAALASRIAMIKESVLGSF